MKVEIITKEIIKPSSPTPHHLRIFQISLFDQLAPVLYVPLVFFYTTNSDSNHHDKAAERSQLLKTSLSQILTRFYPFAGRIKNNVSVECNDEGVEYVEARVHCFLLDILQNPDDTEVSHLLPIDFTSTEAGAGCLLLVQASFFKCGGMALGFCFSHKLADAATFSSLIKGWAATALESSDPVLPEFVAASLFPPIDLSHTLPSEELRTQKCITRRYVFDASKIAALKAKAASASVQHPTRVEAVTALVWKCALTAARSNLGFPRQSALIQSVDLRKRLIDPPLSQHSFGNLALNFVAQAEDSERELQELVNQLRRGKEEFSENNAKRLQGDEDSKVIILQLAKELRKLIKRGDIYYICSSWCKFPFYEADFGWGKPTWVSRVGHAHKNCFVFLDTRDGEGIEAWLTLSEEDMALFERDQELLAFASLNYTALV